VGHVQAITEQPSGAVALCLLAAWAMRSGGTARLPWTSLRRQSNSQTKRVDKRLILKSTGEVNRVAQELTNRDRLCCCRIWPALVAFGVLRHRTSHERTSEHRAASFPLPFLNCGDRSGACVLDRGSYRMARYQRDECCSLRSTRICYLGSCQPVEIKLTPIPNLQ